jgi:hypothetical protein
MEWLENKWGYLLELRQDSEMEKWIENIRK